MYTRYAVYVVPDGPWGDFGAAWLGWDNRTGTAVAQNDDALVALTDRPRKYGFHGTIKPPFRLADGTKSDGLAKAVRSLCEGFEPFPLPSLQVSQIGSFFALTAPDDHAALRTVADKTVETLEPFRAPLTDADLKRRRAGRLTDRQDALLERWGYPYVMDEFKFHLTLSGPVTDVGSAQTQIEAALAPVRDHVLNVDSLCVLGERPDGAFEVIERAAFGA